MSSVAGGRREGWFPLGAVSLVGGASGASKTTVVYQMLVAQRDKQPFFGHPTSGYPFLVIQTDRAKSAYRRTIERMGYTEEQVPAELSHALGAKDFTQELISILERISSPAVFIDGLDFRIENECDKAEVIQFMTALQKIAEHFHVAIIGGCGSPKQKVGEGYAAQRDQISGSAAWGRLAETVVTVRFPAGDDTDNERVLFVLPRNEASEKFELIFEGGRLRVKTEQDEQTKKQNTKEVQWVIERARKAETDPGLKYWGALDLQEAGVSRAAAYRWMEFAEAKKYIVAKPGKPGKHKNGKKSVLYAWNESETNPLWSPPDID